MSSASTNHRLRLPWWVMAVIGCAIIVVAIKLMAYADWRSGTQGTTHLFQALTPEAAEQLIAKGANVNAVSDFGATPLHFAAGRGLPDVVRVLLAHGARVNAVDAEGETPLHWAARPDWDPDEGAHFLKGPFDLAKKTKAAKLLLEHGADPNARTPSGRTPLFAAAVENLTMTRLLVEAGHASVSVRDVDGYSPLHRTQAPIARFLLEHGADVNARDKWEHRTPLHFAMDEDLRQVLLQFGGKE